MDLKKYRNKRICVAVSGGKDSMALLHYLFNNAHEHGIFVCALNCDHQIRGQSSKSDSAFVKRWCESKNIPLISFVAEKGALSSEQNARNWRLSCYAQAIKKTENWQGADFIATAHHANDNAETLLFNLARGTSLSGLTGICDTEINVNGEDLEIIRPIINWTREQIDEYVAENAVKYVIDESNFTNDYTRNKIRNEILPLLESAVPGAVKSVCRFSQLAKRDEDYFEEEIVRQNLISFECGDVIIKNTPTYALFSRACISALKTAFNLKDYTAEHIERLYLLQSEKNGNKFEFLHLIAYKEEGQIAVCKKDFTNFKEIALKGFKSGIYAGQFIDITPYNGEDLQDGELVLDGNCLPESAVIRLRRQGDKFEKFGGGTKSLGDFFTDKKIPQRLRDKKLLIAQGNEIYAIFGVEISNKVKITKNSKNALKLTTRQI